MKTFRITVRGIVQGVGFRPFIYNLAKNHGLKGTVSNSGEGVFITVNSPDPSGFINDIIKLAPPLSVITSADCAEISFSDFEDFTIEHTENSGGLSFVPPDTAICPDCAKDISDNHNRRYDYPFTNCTNCGPRYSIIRDMPYDREKTVMSVFKMCPECEKEYRDPADRRFHAQPNACPVCGPSVWSGELTGHGAVKHIASLIDSGEIVAVKGLGGYHLICDACQDEPIKRLRELKNRPDKPLAVMALPETLEKLDLTPEELHLINSPAAPIVIAQYAGAPVSALVSPMSESTGFMTAYTPLHRILLKELQTDFIVATSGNLKDEPIAKDEAAAEANLSRFTEYFLHHNREIHNRCDDSLAAVVNGAPYILRRARGLAPFPVVLPNASSKCVLGVGAHLKNTVSIAKDGYCFVSQYIGDLDEPDTCLFYEETVSKLKTLYGLEPELIVRDLHPNYHSSVFAEESGIPTKTLQHHAAHMFACMAENSLTDNVLGIILDGTGLGTDKTIWGGEFLLMKNGKMTREAHMPEVAQPGLDAAAKNPGRMLVSYLNQFGLLDGCMDTLISRLGLREKDINMITSMIEKNINCIQTTSCGRYLESIGALVTGVSTNLFEAHSAMKLEGMCTGSGRTFGPVPPCELLSRTLSDIRKNVDPQESAEAVHNSFCEWVFGRATDICLNKGVSDVVLSGGVFQNLKITRTLLRLSENSEITLHLHKKVPPNDSCISLGQSFYGIFNDSVILAD